MAKILVMILKEKFRRLMGLKSLKEDGLRRFGMRERMKEDEAFRSLPVPKKF